METDRSLLEAWQGGDQAAGSTLLGRHFKALYRFFATKVGDETEDLIQATMLACVKYTDRLAAADSFRAYLYTIARNQLHRHLRKHLKQGEVVDFGVSSMADLDPSPSSIAARRERDRHLLGALRQIPVDAQITLELHYWEDMTTGEIAEVLGIPVGTAKSRVRRAKQLLAEAVDAAAGGAADGSHDDLQAWVLSIRDAIARDAAG